jgi:VWFA-related protein
MRRSREFRYVELTTKLLLTVSLTAFTAAQSLGAQAPPDPNPGSGSSAAPAPAAPANAPSAATTQSAPAATSTDTAEVSTHDSAPTFKVRVNLVLVRVVVRDEAGKVIPNLTKDDFHLLDNRKPQTISSFSVETPETHVVKPVAPEATALEPGTPPAPPTPVLPQRFVAVVFDDTDMLMQDAMNVRAAATRLFDALPPSDRVGIYSASGQVTEEFTSDRTRLRDSLLRIVPRPLAGHAGQEQCPNISFYQADQIVDFQDANALNIAIQEFIACSSQTNPLPANLMESMVRGQAQAVLSAGEGQTDMVYRHLEDAMRRLAAMPGQRVMVFVSPGFLLTMHTREQGDLVDRANRSNIVINTIDARGLYTPDVMGDISNASTDQAQTAGIRQSFRLSEQFAQSEILSELADGTGGTFFHNRNDLDVGMQRAVAAPAVAYLLGFSPQNLKIDGRYHTLKVSLANKSKLSIQARHGYYAPKTIKDPAEAAKEEIQEAIFSQEEVHDIPIELQTQFFKSDNDMQAKLAVLTHVDVKGIHFRKDQGRSRDNLTIATAIFDENGNFITGGEKIIEMRLLDPTLTRLSRSGFTVKSSFDVKPGTYLVRMVVRDAEGELMAARNGAVTIPY